MAKRYKQQKEKSGRNRRHREEGASFDRAALYDGYRGESVDHRESTEDGGSMARRKGSKIDSRQEVYGAYEKTAMTMRRDANMISEDWSAPALCPRNAMEKVWPDRRSMKGMVLPDLFDAVQGQESADSAALDRALDPEKF